METPSEEYRLIPLTQGQFATIDAADYDMLMRWKWQAWWRKSTSTFYAVRATTRAERRDGYSTSASMHRELLGLPAGDKRHGDHVNHDTLDNRRSNLRVATASENMMNSRKQRGSKCGLKGVYLHTASQRWLSRIQIGGTRVFLGSYNTAEEAHAAYRSACVKLHGRFACLS